MDILNSQALPMLIQMASVKNLMKKIKKLQSEKMQLNNEIKQLRKEANNKIVKLEQTDSLRNLVAVN